MGIDLPLIWFLIIIFGVMMYVVMDGFDLGIGLLFPLVKKEHDRDVMMNTVAPVWDGNETWLVLGGAAKLFCPARIRQPHHVYLTDFLSALNKSNYPKKYS